MRAKLFFLTATAGLLFAGAVAEAQTEPAAEPDERIVAIYDQLAASLARLKSIEYAAQETARFHLSPSQPGRRSELRHELQGDLFHSSIEPIDRQSLGHEWAYNGRIYQEFSGFLLRISPDLPERFAGEFLARQPIIVPLYFALQDDMRYSALLDQATWERLVPQSTWLRAERVADHLCDVLEVKTFRARQKANVAYQVFLDRELDDYPVKWELDVTLPSPDGKTERRTTHTEGVTQTKIVDTRAGRVVVPINVKWDVFTGDRLDLTMELRIDPETLHVNEPIEESVFTIPRDLAIRVIDESADPDE